MGEGHGQVIMEGGEQMMVVVGKLQLGELVEAVPLDGADDDGAGGIGRPDDGERAGDERVPMGAVELAVGFVEQFEEDRVGRGLIVLRDLFPDGDEAVAVGIGVLHQLVVVVIIENGVEMILLRVGDDPVDALEERGVDGVGRARGRYGRPRGSARARCRSRRRGWWGSSRPGASRPSRLRAASPAHCRD